jgi:hypothetical protein
MDSIFLSIWKEQFSPYILSFMSGVIRCSSASKYVNDHVCSRQAHTLDLAALHESGRGSLRQGPDGGYRITPTVAGRGWLTEPIIGHLSLDDVGPASGHVRYG